MSEFNPITAALSPYMDKFEHGRKSWAFWSGIPAVEVAKKHVDSALEKARSADRWHPSSRRHCHDRVAPIRWKVCVTGDCCELAP